MRICYSCIKRRSRCRHRPIRRCGVGDDKNTCVLVAKLAEALGVQAINKLPGCWECKIDKHWKVVCNGHTKPIPWIDGFGRPVIIEPFEMYFEFNGWPAGSISPATGGLFAAGTEANLDTLMAALIAATKKAQGEVKDG